MKRLLLIAMVCMQAGLLLAGIPHKIRFNNKLAEEVKLVSDAESTMIKPNANKSIIVGSNKNDSTASIIQVFDGGGARIAQITEDQSQLASEYDIKESKTIVIVPH